MKIKISNFKGEAPIINPRMLPSNMAQIATNCRLLSNALSNWLNPSDEATTVSTALTIYNFKGNWLEWPADVDVAESPIANDQYDRIYWTGDGAPKYASLSMVTTGTGKMPRDSYQLGIPKPAGDPAVVKGVKASPPADADEANEGTRYYVYTFVSAFGEEGPPSDPSPRITVNELQTVELSNLDTAPAGDYNIATKRIYRTFDGEYRLVAEIPVEQTTYSDSVENDQLGITLESTNWYAPPLDMKGLIMLPNGIAAGFRKNELLLSEQYQPHAWPYSYPVDAEIVGLGNFGNSVVILTKDQPYLASGMTPDSFAVERLDTNQSCVSKRSIVSSRAGVFYASPDGLIFVGTGGAKNLTQGIFSRREWQSFNPSSMIGAIHDNRYHCYYSAATPGGLIFDLSHPDIGVTRVGENISALYQDNETDKLYFLEPASTQIKAFDSGAGDMSLTWKSKVFVMPEPVSLGAVEIKGEGTLNLTVWADGAQVFSGSISANNPQWLPPINLASEWEFQLTGVGKVVELTIAEDMQELE